MRRLGINGLLLLSLTAAQVGCSEPKAAATQASEPPQVGFITVQEQDVPLRTELPGRTVAVLTAEVRPQVGGMLLSRKFEEGAEVKEGQVLYQIDAAAYKATVSQAQAALASAKARIDSSRLRAERYGELLTDEAVSKQEADDATASYQEALAAVAQAKAALTAAQLDLSYTQVRAPISGRIGLSRVTPGALVAANQSTALTTIRNLHPIYVDFVQSSVEMLRLRKRLSAQGVDPGKAEVELVLEDGSHYPHKGRLLSREVSVDAATGAVTLRAEVPNPDEALLPGMYVRVAMAQGVAHNAVLAPQQGVGRNPRAEPIAWVIDEGGKAEQRTLEVAQTVGTCWLVTKGLADGDRLIVEGTQNIGPGTQVKGSESPQLAACEAEATPLQASTATDPEQAERPGADEAPQPADKAPAKKER